jgi:HAD superfamily hydrolase (TIGR01456 family)
MDKNYLRPECFCFNPDFFSISNHLRYCLPYLSKEPTGPESTVSTVSNNKQLINMFERLLESIKMRRSSQPRLRLDSRDRSEEPLLSDSQNGPSSLRPSSSSPPTRRGRLTERCSNTPQPITADKSLEMGDFAFVFDIDGVMSKGDTPLPGSSECLKLLNQHKVPFTVITNSGGQKTEEEYAKTLSRRFGVSFSADRFVQSHTPYRSLVKQLADKTVLVLGGVGDSARSVATKYGFKNVITSSDIFTANEKIWPFEEYTADAHRRNAASICSSTPLTISAIFLFSSPRDWGLDMQIISDLLLSEGGKLGTVSKLNGNSHLPNNGYQQDGQPPIFFCNPDHDWATQYPNPRLAQGAFKAAFEGLWCADKPAGTCLISSTCGKPTSTTFELAESQLLASRAPGSVPLKTIYMIGDNPASDIRLVQCNKSKHGITWRGFLVCSGVYQKGEVPAFKPNATFDHVLDAVVWALKFEMDLARAGQKRMTFVQDPSDRR